MDKSSPQAYSASGGTLTNGQIPTQQAPTGVDNNSPVTTAIPIDGITTSNPTPPPLPPNPSSPNYSSIIAGAVPPPTTFTTPNGTKVDANGNTITDTSTPATTASTGILDRIKSLIGMDTGKSAYTQQQLDQSGATALQARQNVLTGKITAINTQAQLQQQQLEQNAIKGGSTSSGFLSSQQQEIARQSAISALSLKAEYDMNSGDLQNAKDTAQQAVNLKYGDIEQQIDQNTKLLQLYTPFMNAEQKTKADALTQQLEAQKTDLADNKSLQTNVIHTAQSAGDNASAGKALGLDPNSPTFKQDLAQIQTGIVSNGQKVLGNSTTGYFTYDPSTGKTTPISSGTGGSGTGGSGDGVTPSLPVGLTEDSANFYAQMATSGVSPNTLVPSLGMGTAAVASKNAILNKIAKNAKTLGIDGATFGAMLTDSQAKNKAYTALQKVGSQTEVNASNANADFAQLIGLSQTLDNSSLRLASPALEKWLQTGQLSLTGNKDVNNFLAVLTTSLTEYAKVVSGSTSGSAVSDTANAQLQKLLSSGMSTDTIKSFAQTAKQEMNNRTTSYDTALKSLFSNLTSVKDTKGGLGGDTSSESILPTDVQSTITANTTISADGKTAYLPASIWAQFKTQGIQDQILQEAKNDGINLLIK